jgi:hypothetical protein
VRSLSASETHALLADAVKRYATLSDPYGDEALAGLDDVTTTEACTVATALLRAQGLTPFEFSVWFAGNGR